MARFRLPNFSLVGAVSVAALVSLYGCNGGGSSTDSTSTTGTTTTGSTTTTSTTGDAKRPDVKGTGVDATGDTIKVGVVASTSGDQKPWGDDSLNGAKIAIKEVNDAGGIDGKKIELDVQDSQSKAEAAKTATDKLLSDGVVAIVGETSSGNTAQIETSAYSKGVPDVAVGATRTALSDMGSNFFRVCYTDDLQGPVMAKFAYQERGIKTIAIMTDNKQPYSQGLSKSFKDEYEKLGGQVVDEESYETGQSTFTTQLTNLKAKNPQGIFLSGYFPEVGPIASSARDLGITAELFGGDGWDSPKILESGGKAIIGSFMCNHYNNKEPRPIVGEFLGKWKAGGYGDAPGTTMGALGYDAMKLMLTAIKTAADADPAHKVNSLAIIKALSNVEGFKGVSGDITLKGHDGNPPKRALVVQIEPASEGFQVFRKAYDPQ